MRTHWVMDYETMTNLFVAVFQDYISEETKIFKIHSSLNNDILFVNSNNKDLQ